MALMFGDDGAGAWWDKEENKNMEEVSQEEERQEDGARKAGGCGWPEEENAEGWRKYYMWK